MHGFAAYLNPVATQVATTPETNEYTSIKQRSDHVEAPGATGRLEAAKDGSVAESRAAIALEESKWLCPIEDCHGLDSTCRGMMQGFSLGSYVQLVDYTGRDFRQGNDSISGSWPRSSSGSDLVPKTARTGWRSSDAAGY